MQAAPPVRRSMYAGRSQPAFAYVFAVFLLAATLFGQSPQRLTEDEVEAGFIYNFTKYTEWPLLADGDNARFHLCVAGDGGVVEQLDRAVNGKSVANRSIAVRHLDESADVTGCEVLYVGRIARRLEERLLSVLSGQPILTIGSAPGYLRGAGMITFVVEGARVRFDINARMAAKVNIRFDSRMLALARNKNEVSR